MILSKYCAELADQENRDCPHLSSKVLTPPDGQSDSEFINNFGKKFNEIEDNQNYVLWGNIVNSHGYSNSNNLTYQLGVNAGVGNQLNSFNPRGIEPGYGTGLAPGGLPSLSQSAKKSILSLLNKIEKRLKQLKSGSK